MRFPSFLTLRCFCVALLFVISLPVSAQFSDADRASSRPVPRKNTGRQEDGRIKPIKARIGQIAVEEVAVRSGINGVGRELAYLGKGRYVAVVAETADYIGVMMEDKSVGWINRLAVKMLNHEVTLFQVTRPTPPATPRETAPRTQSPAPQEDEPTDEDASPTNRPLQGDNNMDREIVIPANVRGLIEEAVSYLGTPYVWGGTSRNGLDCSAFLQNVFATQGVKLPRVSRDQALVGEAVDWKDLRSGDRLYFTMGKEQVTHCGIYIAEGYFIHSSTNKRGVDVDRITTKAYYNSLVAIRRSL